MDTIGLTGLDDLKTAIGRANSDDQVHGIVITGKHGHFDVGIGVNLLEQIDSSEDRISSARSRASFRLVEDGGRGHKPGAGTTQRLRRRLVEQRYLGQKSASGVYKYEAGDSNLVFCGLSARIVGEEQKAAEIGSRDIEEEIERRPVMRLVNEAFDIQAEGIAQRESDLDVAIVLGTRFPDFRGGPLR